MRKVSGIGDFFFRAIDSDTLTRWYRNNLGVDPTTYSMGRFASLADPEGNPIQLWEPADEAAAE
jgi:glyoxylase I family protein